MDLVITGWKFIHKAGTILGSDSRSAGGLLVVKRSTGIKREVHLLCDGVGRCAILEPLLSSRELDQINKIYFSIRIVCIK